MKKIILIGAGGHAKSCVDIIKDLKKYKITYLLEKKISNNLDKYKKVIYNKNNLLSINKKIKFAFVCFGQIKNRFNTRYIDY